VLAKVMKIIMMNRRVESRLCLLSKPASPITEEHSLEFKATEWLR
jgi:hypothetical protein